MVCKKSAFTLLEMLVVLGIIAVILGALTVSFSAAQRKTRDAKRRGDIKSIANTLEQYYSLCAYVYPTAITPPIPCTGHTEGFITDVPKDPRGNTYLYQPSIPVGSTAASGFALCTNNLETESITGYCLFNQQ